MTVRDLFYVASNAFIPLARVSSTARRGDKWFNQVEPGDTVALRITETNEVLGMAVVVEKELVPYFVALANADHNACAFNPNNRNRHPETALREELQAAYGSNISNDELFSILHIIPVTGAKLSGPRTFAAAYAAIESENRYQIDKHGEEGQIHSIDEWTNYIRVYAEEAASEATHGDEEAALDTIRKVTTMGVVALQAFGSPHREGY